MFAIMMKGSLGSLADPVGFYPSFAEAQQAVEGHQAGSFIVPVDGNGKPLVPVFPELAEEDKPAEEAGLAGEDQAEVKPTTVKEGE